MFRTVTSSVALYNFSKRSIKPAAACVSKVYSRNVSSNVQVDPITPQPKRTLHNEILQRIKVSGPLTVSEYMKLVLTNPITVFHQSQLVKKFIK